MTRRPKVTAYTPLVSACQLPHHRPGSRVVFTEWDHGLREIRRLTGRVVTHLVNGRRITVELDLSGRHHTVECGAVGPHP